MIALQESRGAARRMQICNLAVRPQVPAPLLELQFTQGRCAHEHLMDGAMLGWTLIFVIVALLAGYLGFFALAGVAAGIAKFLFLLFLALLVISFAMRAFRGDSVL